MVTMCEMAIERMRKDGSGHGGVIINISSIAGEYNVNVMAAERQNEHRDQTMRPRAAGPLPTTIGLHKHRHGDRPIGLHSLGPTCACGGGGVTHPTLTSIRGELIKLPAPQ